MKLIFTWKELLIMNKKTTIARFPATCNVRNELNKKRPKNQVIYTTPLQGHPTPFYPRQFPSGIHTVLKIEWLKDLKEVELFGPVKIRTTATRDVFTWDLDVDGDYWQPTGKTQTDAGYHIHHTAKYTTTHGCIRGGNSENQMVNIAQIIEPVLENNETVYLEVL